MCLRMQQRMPPHKCSLITLTGTATTLWLLRGAGTSPAALA